jgi:hypothetical protein
VDYVPDVNQTIEQNAAAGTWRFSIHFKTFDTIYLFDLRLMVQVNTITGRERPIRRVIVTNSAHPPSRL